MDFTLELNLLNFPQQYGRLKPCQFPHCHYKHSLILHRQHPSGLKAHFGTLFMEEALKKNCNVIMWHRVSALMD